ncbi:protein mono-ADP-ribosyltransferase PARP14-like [Ptychodera flava]|uniref:protein mono-ADP-ribosyltransferase PARP14-like n=1 Tax=Ptychodera flava TaxID=63121 RepID=UPI00396A5E11
MHVDVIVNAANTSLDSSTGGLTKAVADAGGPSIQAECARIIGKRGRLLEGQAVATGAGNLPCKLIVHAVAPTWYGSGYGQSIALDDKRKEVLLLTDVVRNSLKIAEKMGHTSIAIPAIGAGGNRFPLDLCVKTILEAVDSYCRTNKPKSLMEIRIVDNADTTCQKFQNGLVEQYGYGSVVITNDERSTDDWQMAPSHSDGDMEEDRTTGAGAQSTKNPYVMKTAEGKSVTLIKGSIAKQKVDVIVNTTQPSLDLNTGAVSKAILKVAGQQLQQEVNIQKTEVSTNEGDILVTTATGSLKCKKVFHVLCCQWDSGGKAEKLLKSVMQGCFDKADKSGMQSIAFPAIGTGGLNFPKDVTAKIMYDEAKNYSAANPQSQLTDIKFVVYDQDHETITAFEDVITKLTGVQLRKRHHRRPPTKQHGASMTGSRKKGYSSSPLQSSQYSLTTSAVQQSSTAGIGKNYLLT